MRIVTESFSTPIGLTQLLQDIGDGENGFGGSPVATGELTLDEYIQKCIEMKDSVNLKPG